MQRSAAIAPQIDDQPIDIFSAQSINQATYVSGGTTKVFHTLLLGTKVYVKGWYFDDTNAHFAAFGFAADRREPHYWGAHFNDFCLRRLLFELDGVPHDGDASAGFLICIRANHLQLYGGPLRSPNQLNDVVQAPTNNINHRPVNALTYCGDLVRWFHRAGFCSWACRYQSYD